MGMFYVSSSDCRGPAPVSAAMSRAFKARAAQRARADALVRREPGRASAGLVRHLVALGLASALLAGIAAPPAAAFKIFGMRFFEAGDEAVEDQVPDAQRYELDFTVTGETGLEDALRNASELAREGARPPPGSAGMIARARGDYGRLLAALYAQGHYGGTIRIDVNGVPVENLRPDVDLPDPVPVSVAIDTGPVFRFGEIRIDGLPPTITTEEKEAVLEIDDWAMRVGEVAKSGAILEAEGRLVDVWRQRGYPKAEIVKRQITADHATNMVDVTLVVTAGPEAVLGGVEVTGTKRMNPVFVARQTGIRPGEPYDPDTLIRARERLRRLSVFSSVSIQEAAVVGDDGILPLTFNVAERKRRLIGGGASYSSTEGATLEGYWAHRNLFGQAESIRFDASVSRIGSAAYQDFSYAASASFRKPGVFTPDTDLTLVLAGKRDFVDTYEVRSLSAAIGLEHMFSERLILKTAFKVERSLVEDAFGENKYLIASLPTELEYDGRDNKLDPTEGMRGAVRAEPFYDFEGSTAALVADAEISKYLSFDPDNRFILAGRLAAGTILGGELEDIPADKRFFLGGGGSIRGYEYRTVGPEVDSEVVGGLSYWEASLEMRVRVTDSIGLVPFVDAGAAYEDPLPGSGSGDILIGAGLGLRYHTPLGPLRFDVAMPLTPRDGDPSVAFYVGLGQAF